MNESIVNHLFLPHYLPSCAEQDFLTHGNHENEYKLLECMKEYFYSMSTTAMLPLFETIHRCMVQWSNLQNPQNFSVGSIRSAIEQMSSGSFLPVYFRAQNAAILIEIDHINVNQPIISAWQVLLPAGEVTSTMVPHLACFPITTYKLQDRAQLTSTSHCELLIDFMNHTIEYSKASKASREVDEIREVPESHYVCQWWIQHFDNIEIIENSNPSIRFNKKHRDQIRLNGGLVPFRRSGLWMTIKTVLHTILTKHLGLTTSTIVYKLLITQFLTHVIYKQNISTDLQVHCVRKIVRRLNKIECLPAEMETDGMSTWIQRTKQDIVLKIDEIIPKPVWQKRIPSKNTKENSSLGINVQLKNSKIYRHSCLEFKTYLEELKSIATPHSVLGLNSYIDNSNVHQADYIPSMKILTDHFKYTIDIVLSRIELWVESSLEVWINRTATFQNNKNRFSVLLDFFEEYQIAALNHCWSEKGPTDTTSYSRFILTSLTIIRCMYDNLCKNPSFERLKLHCINIPNLLDSFEYLILPKQTDMIRARALYNYLDEFSRKSYPDLLINIKSCDAFGVYYANRSSMMNESIQRIRDQADRDQQQKIREVNDAKERYRQLINSISGLSCTCDYQYVYWRKCHRCITQEQANTIQVGIFECPMPKEKESALAVIFELQMPTEIRCYREILWQFINRPKPSILKNNMYEWLHVSPHQEKLGSYFTGRHDCKVKLVSQVTSATQTHYRYPPSIVSTPVEGFLFDNSLEVQISLMQPISFEDERRILTPRLNHLSYKQLQFTLNTTEFLQNNVIANLSSCPTRIKPFQFVEFGSFRSGHRLQWWNLLVILEMDSLSIAEESVAILIIHSILQYGPLKTDQSLLPNHWCTESHQQIFKDHFVDELLDRLNHHLDNIELNWQNELALVVITAITMRIFTLCNPTRINEVVELVMKCRRIGEEWIIRILTSIQTISVADLDEIKKLHLKMIHISICSILTFSADPNRIHSLLCTNQHVVSLLKATTMIHDNIILSKNESDMSIFMKNLMRYSKHILVIIQPTIADYLQKTSFEALNEFAAIYWAVIRSKGKMNEQWKKRYVDMHDGWYDCQYESRLISIDCIQGLFLVDEMTIGFLPEQITSNELFTRVFDSHVFEVQAAELPHTYITKHSYHNGRVLYEFHFDNRTKCLIVNERHLQQDNMFQLIPHHCFEKELPDTFVSDHSHWWNAKTRHLQFRPVQFQNKEFLDDKPYVLNMDTGHVITVETDNMQMLVNQSSKFFCSLFSSYFSRLDDQPYVYMMRDNNYKSNVIIHIYLSRLNIAFQYNSDTQVIISREYSDMRIDQNQWLGTLTGLTSGLLLSPLSINNQTLESYPYRKLIVPFGNVLVTATTFSDHQTVTIQRTSIPNEFLRHYFVFILNDRLNILQSTDSPTGWFYLALLHAMTSHPLPDEYTKMAGMERAFQLLNSAGCWSDQSFDGLSLNILAQIASISPKVNYFPPTLQLMVKIDWNKNGLAYSLQHFGYYLIAKQLINASQQFSFMYPSLNSNKTPEVFEGKLYNETLLKKLYWEYRDSYNPIARLSSMIEEDIQKLCYSSPHQSDPEYCLHIASYNPVSLTTNLQCNVEPFYIQILKTVLESSTTLLECVTFPQFITYERIEDITFVRNQIDFIDHHTPYDKNRIMSEIESCFSTNCCYEDKCRLVIPANVTQVNQLFTSWRNNHRLHSFLSDVQNRICSTAIKMFKIKVSYQPQTFSCERIENHHTIQLKVSCEPIDQTLVQRAHEKFYQNHSTQFNKTIVSLQPTTDQKEFPHDIFPFTDDQNNPLSDITNYFKNHLTKSWGKLFEEEESEKVDPSIEEINVFLHSLREESTKEWNELNESIRTSNEQLFESGLVSRITPTTLIYLLQQIGTTIDLNIDQKTLLGGILVSWTLEQQLERALHFAAHEKWEDLKKEIFNTPHCNWIPSEHIPWLILELEMNITIREAQIKVARHMMQSVIVPNDTTVKNIVMQMNMGEGKTSVILPMLALSLSSTHSSLVRIIVLKSLFPTNYQSLRYKLGGLLNRRIFPFVCRRDLNFNDAQIKQISNRFQQGLHNCDVVLTAPEDILSFDLLTMDKCRREEFDVGQSMLTLQRWLKRYIRDVLDESDEILHVKYQLIYTIGGQQQVDGGVSRWETIQSILDLVKKHAAEISRTFTNEVCYKPPERKSAFPQFRLQSQVPFPQLCKNIADDWLNQRSLRHNAKDAVLSFILKTELSVDTLLNKFPLYDLQLFLIVRGLLSAEVLLVTLKKRYRVNYGINPNLSLNRLLAVPFRAKDVATDRTEFGHPDVALVLTHLTYYYSGLSDSQMTQCFDRLSEEETDSASIYDQWISYEYTDDIPTSIKQWKGVNLKDYQQKTQYLFPKLRYNMLVVNYFLNHFVFPREAKQFPYKLIASAWDLSSSSRSKIITGFSGTNDTQLLLPIDIRQDDLPELQKTDAIVVNNLLQRENESYQSLPINIISNEILEQILKHKENINVILDVGALFIDGTNQDIAMKWLNLSNKTQIDYAVYFNSDSIVVCDRQNHPPHLFVTSPASERLDRCVFYLDEIHTRGTDFKFPKGFRAAVTLGNGLTKDRFVQACMRMRKLGNGHSLTFLSSYEVHHQITRLILRTNPNTSITVKDILRWVYENTVYTTWDGLHHWASQSLSFQRKVTAFQGINWNNYEQIFTNEMMKELANACLEPEIIELKAMYGARRALQTVFDIHCERYRQNKHFLSPRIRKIVIQRLLDYGGGKTRLSQLLDEEQQRELEQELEEERQLERPPPVKPHPAVLYEEIKRLGDISGTVMDLTQFPQVFRPLSYAFIDTTFQSLCQANSWSSNLWISTEFQRVISTKGESLDPFLRPPRWVLIYRNQHIIFVNALEANWLIGRLQSNSSPITTLRLLLPRVKRIQSILVNTATLTVPPTIQLPKDSIFLTKSLELLVQFFIFNGTLFFETDDEQTTYCECLSLCPKPRTNNEEEAFQNGWIDIDGYVDNAEHRRQLRINRVLFNSNPLLFIKTLLEIRNNAHATITSHIGSIILNSMKLFN
ncbi:hypothetical protein I4U23_023339 [Adineta vaga]|nr:hypothetical protein I4U23_023339 [Adineta vaga]